LETRKKSGESIVIREIPFGVNRKALVEKIAALVNEHKLDGVSALRDESDRNGTRVVLDLKRGTIPDIIINSLYKFTALETTFGFNMLAVVNNRPQLLNLKTALEHFLDHRRVVVIRRTRFDLAKSEARAHILEGLRRALDNIDEVVAIIRASKTPQNAKDNLMARFAFSGAQSQAILEMRLQRLTNLEHEKLLEEYTELLKFIAYLKSILEEEGSLRKVIRDELSEIKAVYASPRKTELMQDDPVGIDVEDLIPDEGVVIALSRRGYIKRTNIDLYQQQKRGGKGIAGVHTGDEDFVQDFITTSNHQYLLLFTNRGRMHQLKVHQVPEGSRIAKGVHIANLLPLEKDEYIATVLTVRDFTGSKSFFFATRQGMIKRSEAQLYARCRKTGLQALGLRDGDELIAVNEVDDGSHVILTTGKGMAIRFACKDARSMGRIAAGVKGIALRTGDKVVACVIMRTEDESADIMSVSSNGYGKRTKMNLYRLQSRGGYGVINFKVTSKTGPVIGALAVNDTDTLLLLTSTNKIIRIGIGDMNSIGRATQGVRLVSIDEGGHVVSFDRVDKTDASLTDVVLAETSDTSTL
jgi:DNA gyrase subunit A